MGKDNRRIAAPDNCMSPNAFKKLIKISNLVNEKGLRQDERTPDELRSMSLSIGITPEVTGSAYLECGNTKIICSVNGPRDALHKSDSSTKRQLYCEFKYASFSCTERQSYQPTEEELGISKSIQNALEPVVMLHKFPKARLDICILVLENDGGAISASITCAGAALSNAGVEMYDFPIGCSLIQCGSHVLLDPTAEEERYSKLREDFGKITIAMMAAYNSQVIYMESYGNVKNELMHKGLKILQTSCEKILIDVRECVKQHLLNKESIDNITADELKLFQPQKYITTFLENNVRPDGRKLIEFRPVLIDVGSFATANGSALVRLSGTSVLCGVKVELTNPTNNEPNKGFFVPNVTLTSICSNRFTPGPPSEQAQVYTQLIMDLWKNSDFLSPEKLCILEGKLAWCIFAEMICLSYDGNILDACVLALIAALKNTRLPEVVINPDDNSIEVTNNTVALDLSSYVFSVTYAVIKDNVIADPSLEEETFEDTSVTIFLKEDNTTCIHSSGFVQDDSLMHCIKCAKDRHSEMKSLIDALN